MAVKSSSLKSEAESNKSGENNSDTRHSSGRDMRAMMLANLHGETILKEKMEKIIKYILRVDKIAAGHLERELQHCLSSAN